MSDPEDLEALAALEHKSWSTWTSYMLAQIQKGINEESADQKEGEIVLRRVGDLSCIHRWQRQLATPYASLSDKEKESDRDVVRQKLPIYRAPSGPEAFRAEADRQEAAGAPVVAGVLRVHAANLEEEAAQAEEGLVERLAVAVLGELDISHASAPTEAALRDRIKSVLRGGK
jgi:hypothetical protein